MKRLVILDGEQAEEFDITTMLRQLAEMVLPLETRARDAENEASRLAEIIREARCNRYAPADPNCPFCGGAGHRPHEHPSDACFCLQAEGLRQYGERAAAEDALHDEEIRRQARERFLAEHGHSMDLACGPACNHLNEIPF